MLVIRHHVVVARAFVVRAWTLLVKLLALPQYVLRGPHQLLRIVSLHVVGLQPLDILVIDAHRRSIVHSTVAEYWTLIANFIPHL